MEKIKAIIDDIAPTDITVLIKGENGTRKGLLAQAIHFNSLRRNKPLIKVNCSAIPSGLLENELFGYEKGALPGVHIRKPGKMALANGATILLKDIEKLDILLQARLVEVLRRNSLSPVSIPLEEDGTKIAPPRVLLTIQDYSEKSLNVRHFYGDLFSKVHFISITVPPLRERREQIPSLSRYYFDFYCKKYGKSIPPFSSKIMHAFREYEWPGNIDELESVIQRMVISGDGDGMLETIFRSHLEGVADLGFGDHASIDSEMGNKAFFLKEVKKKAAESVEIKMIKEALEETHWNRKQAAKLIGISYNALLYKVRKYNLL